VNQTTRNHNTMTDSVFKEITTHLITPSPYQHRRTFTKLKELGESIARDGLVQPITVRSKGNGFELIAGERRYRAAKDVAGLDKIMARIVYVDDHTARRMCATENMQRDDLSAVESIEAIIELVDAEFSDNAEYMALGNDPADRVRGLLGGMCAITYENASDSASEFFNKFIKKVDDVFSSLPRPVEWRSFYNNDLGITTIPEDIKEIASSNKLNKSQTKSLARLAKEKPDMVREMQDAADDDGVLTWTYEDGKTAPLADVSAKELLSASGVVSAKRESTGDFHVSNKENDWYTPPEYIEASRAVLGDIDLDPATSDFAQQTVKAKQYYTKEDNSLDKPWHGKVWMNPPYSMPEIKQFAEKIVQEFQDGRVSEAIVLTNNSSDALLGTAGIACFPSSRVKFYNPDSEVMATRQGQTLFYFGDNRERFSEVFAQFGAIVEKL
jgi:hypothetical protein